ncbi:MAG: chloride channel protein [Microthrixaceae bacterium]
MCSLGCRRRCSWCRSSGPPRRSTRPGGCSTCSRWADCAIGLAYHYGGGRSDEGNNLILAEIHDPRDWIPGRMAPMVLVGTVVTHLFGGSAGREGTAIQMSGSLTDGFARLAHVRDDDRRVLLVAAIVGGFGSVFGVPVAGAVFGLEVQAIGRLRRTAVLPAVVASVVGDLVVRGLGVHHTPTPRVVVDAVDPMLLGKAAVAGVAFGAAAAAFTWLTRLVKSAFAMTIRWVPARPLVGGVLVVVATLLAGTRAYNGLSIGLIERSLVGGEVPTAAFLLKLLFTAITLGSGFVGGEVTPLFVIGATLGATASGVLDAPVPLMSRAGVRRCVRRGSEHPPGLCGDGGGALRCRSGPLPGRRLRGLVRSQPERWDLPASSPSAT